MKKKAIILSGALLLVSALVINAARVNAIEEDVKEAVLTGYVHGAFNELNPDAMASTFYKDFAIFSTDGQNLRKYPIANWLESVKRQKSNPDFKPEENVWTPEFQSVDVNGNAAAVKLDLHHDGELVYTDYLSLLKFDDGWKIVAKVYHRHE
jgi:hypothetical protein